MLQYSRSSSCHRIGGPAAMGVLGPVCPAAGARPCTIISASAPACSTRTTPCYAPSSSSITPFRQVRARPMALPLSAGKGQGFSAQPSKGPAGGKGPQGGSESPSAMADKLFKQKGAPEPFLGPVFTVKSPGKGQGLAAARQLNGGELLLISPALATVTEDDLELPDEDDEEAEEVSDDDVMDLKFRALQQRLLMKKYTPAELAWFNALTPVLEDSTPDPQPSQGAGRGKGKGKGAAAAAAPVPETPAAGAEAEAGPQGFQPGPVPSLDTLITTARPKQAERTLDCPADEGFVEGLIQANAFEAASEDADLAYVALQDDPAQEVMGLWPHYALLNHSCMPNTISYPHKGVLITRASRGSTSKGAELTTNYIGDLINTPLDVRREALEDTYGFVCSCTRCKDEERVGQDLKTLITDIYEACTEQVRDELEDAVDAEDTEALQGLRDQLAAFVEVLDAAFTKTRVSDQTQIWIQAGLFELYELLHTTLEALGQQDLRLLELLQALAAETQPGSELHCFYARRLLDAQQQAEEEEQQEGAELSAAAMMSPSASGVKHAEGLCYQAHSTRFGPISRKVFLTILQTRRELEAAADEDEDQD